MEGWKEVKIVNINSTLLNPRRGRLYFGQLENHYK